MSDKTTENAKSMKKKRTVPHGNWVFYDEDGKKPIVLNTLMEKRRKKS
jgi:hypothetical protein